MKRTVVLGVSGGIAAFKATQLTSNLIKKGYDIEVVMTQNATEFITPLILESLTKHNAMVFASEKVADRDVKHISIAYRTDISVLISATASVITKIVHGLADDMLTTTFLATDCPKVAYPAVNTGMYENLVIQKNLKVTKTLGYKLVEPEVGYLACGGTEEERLADITHIEECICHTLETTELLGGKRVLITAEPTHEALDPVRFISNYFSGEMGYEIARAARGMGADVTLTSGPVWPNVPRGARVVQVISTQDMFEAVQQEYADCGIITEAAAVGGYRAQETEEDKIKRQGEFLEIIFVKNPDILAWLGEHRVLDQVTCGLTMETEHLLEHATERLSRKNCDMIVANNLHEQGADSQGDTSVVTLLRKNHTETLDLTSKYEVGVEMLTRLAAPNKGRGEA